MTHWASIALCATELIFMHQSIPAVPIRPPPPGATEGHLLTLSVPGQSRGWGCNFIAAPGLGICVPQGNPRAFDTCVLKVPWVNTVEKMRCLWSNGL